MNNSIKNFVIRMARPDYAKVRGHRTDGPSSWVSDERRIVYNTKVPRNGKRFETLKQQASASFMLIRRLPSDLATPRILFAQRKFRLWVNYRVGKLRERGEYTNTVHSIPGPHPTNLQSEPGRPDCTSNKLQPATPQETHSVERLR
jgi:hypothetical protein